MTRRLMLAFAAVALVLVTVGVIAAIRADTGLVRDRTVVNGVPLTVVRSGPAAAGQPGAVVVHGLGGSATLMQPFADTLARNGYVVVLPDLAGHGASTRAMSHPRSELDTAIGFLRGQSGVDPDRIVLIGHSRGAWAVTDLAAGRADIAATVAISLGQAPMTRPRNLLVLYGQFEPPILGQVALTALEPGDPTATVTTGRTYGTVADGTARRAEAVPGVEHVSILFSGAAHSATLDWLDAAVRPDAAAATVHPTARLWPAALLLLGLLLGFLPVARVVAAPRDAPPVPPVAPIRAVLAVVAGLGAGVVVGVVVGDPVLGLHVGGYAAVVLLAFGAAAMLTVGRWRPRWASWSALARAALLAGYATAMVIVPIHLGLTWVQPSAARLVPMAALLVAVWLLFGVAERLSGGRWPGHAGVLAVAVALLVGLAVTGLAPAFIVLVAPLLAGLLGIGSAVAAVLRRLAPPWLAAGVAAVAPAWVVAVTMPLA